MAGAACALTGRYGILELFGTEADSDVRARRGRRSVRVWPCMHSLRLTPPSRSIVIYFHPSITRVEPSKHCFLAVLVAL